ncbi:MAG TPA: hypothetical protein VNH11_02815 [Pirellulales bacterium]|nr:hypothetical protein [Pirellulales bacterium]
MFVQEQKVDQLMARFKALMAEERRRPALGSAAPEANENIQDFLRRWARATAPTSTAPEADENIQDFLKESAK